MRIRETCVFWKKQKRWKMGQITPTPRFLHLGGTPVFWDVTLRPPKGPQKGQKARPPFLWESLFHRALIGQIKQFSMVNTREHTHKAREKRADSRGNLSENIEEHTHKTKNAKNLRKTCSELNGSEKNWKCGKTGRHKKTSGTSQKTDRHRTWC